MFLSLLFILTSACIAAQIEEPVRFSTKLQALSGSEMEIVFTGTIDDGWHVYSTKLPEGGPVSASLTLEELKGAEAEGELS